MLENEIEFEVELESELEETVCIPGDAAVFQRECRG